MTIRNYAFVGLGGRAEFFYGEMASHYSHSARIVGFCDVNETRMAYANTLLQEKYSCNAVPAYRAEEFDRMIQETDPDTVIVTSIDRTHHKYIIRAMELGCDVISEKPMTIDAEKCQAILDAVQRTGRKLRVTFNYRYAPHNTKIRELLMEGTIGEVLSVNFEWLLNTQHGADYFRRWHRDKRNSGGLLVHKSTHHFDLMNFWLDSKPDTVFAMGDLRFYGRENAENRGVTQFYQRAYGSRAAKDDPFALHLEEHEPLKRMYLEAEHEDGYLRDQSVFGDNISIEDTMGVMVKYKNKAILNYSLNAYLPWEGFKVDFNGTKGRLEVKVVEQSYVNAGGAKEQEGAVQHKQIVVYPQFAAPYIVDIEEGSGGHGGGDPVMLRDIFDAESAAEAEDRFGRAASHLDGAWSILTGIAANRSIATGLPVRVEELVKL
ncbi:dehydrogenase [Paenibacillus sp. CAA11]|uniref:Gfo/Idh/MocA family protein n=1 Tax=Paenibacillus sp. CAA11 TaxID=1532905 RepID=UPI000D37F187|nr:Gfo/Idh/MocA family oxidoreductase [Paenibacillus sp. CAA11]AWB47033.1 dehydrogenase [Paenibacillus sp. CAA11]